MEAAIFYNVPSAAEAWEHLLKEKGWNVRIFNSIPVSEEQALEKKLDLIVVQTSTGSHAASAAYLKSLGYDTEQIPVAHSFYFAKRLRDTENPNKDTPLIYTTLVNDEKIQKIRELFDSLPETYFFDERDENGLGPLIDRIMPR